MTGPAFNEYDEIIQSGHPLAGNEYDEIIAREATTQQQALAGAKFVASKRDPARWAQVLQIAQRTKLPADVVDRNFDRVSQADSQQRTDTDCDRLITDTPGLATWLTNPDNATLGRDEIAALARVDRGTRIVAQPDQGAAHSFGTAATTGWNDLNASAWQLGAAYGLASPDVAARNAAESNRRAAALRAQMPDYAKEYNTAMAQAGGNLDTAFHTFSTAQDALHRGEILNALKGYATGAVKTVGEALDMLRTAGSRPRGFVYSQIENLAQMAPSMVLGPAGAAAAAGPGAAIGAGVGGVLGSPTGLGEVATIPAGAAIGGAIGGAVGMAGGTFLGMAPVNVGSEINSELTKRGFDITSESDLRRAYSDPGLMAEIRSKAERKGLTMAAVASVFSSFAGKVSSIAREATPLVRAAAATADVSAQAGGMAGADLAGQVAAEKGDLSKVSVGEAAQTGVSMLGYGIGQTALGIGRRAMFHSDPVTAATEVTARTDEALRAQRDAQALSEIGSAVQEAKTTAQVPERLKSLVEMAAGGRDDAQVYFQDGEWDKYWQSKGASPAKAASDIMGDDGKAYYDAKTTGAPLAIPLSDYVSKVAPTDHFNGLLDVARTRPEGMSLAEAHEYLQSLPATMKALAEEANTLVPAGEPANQSGSEAKIGETVTEQLATAGVPASAAKAQGSLYEAAFRTLGQRVGVDPLELYNKYNLSISREQAGESTPGESSSSFAQDSPEGARGRIRLGDKGISIQLLADADRSTFLHETGHFYLEVLRDLSSQADAHPEVKADFGTIRQWLGAEEGQPLTRQQHEQFARGFESYLMEGKAPSHELRPAFARFRGWLIELYRSLGNLRVLLTPEVRGVFDRLLASHDEIRRATSEAAVTPLFHDPRAIGMNESQADSYRSAVEEARQAAEEELTHRIMKDIRREESADWKALRDPIRADVEAEINAEPTYKALSLLTKGTRPDGSPLPEGTAGFKLDREGVRRAFGDAAYKELPRGVTAAEGVDPEIAAEMLGFRSGRDLVDALAHAPKRETLVERMTDERMRAQHGDRMTEPQIQETALNAVRGEKRIQVLRKELEYLASDHLAALKGLVRTVTKKVPPTEAVRAEAATIVGQRKVSELKPRLYELAAQRAAKEAREALLRGDVNAAFDAKRKELLTTEVFRAATAARESIDAALDDFKAVFKADTTLAKSRDMNFVNAARAVLASFGIGHSDKPPAAYLEQLDRYDPDQAAAMQGLVNDATYRANAARADYRNLEYNDFQSLQTAVQSLWNLSRRSWQIEIDGVKIDREQVREELGVRLSAISKPGPRAGYHEAVSLIQKAKLGLMGVRAATRRVESWVRAVDAADPDGPFRRYVWNPIREGTTAYRAAKAPLLKRYAEIVKGLEGSMSHERIPAPELAYTFDGTREVLGAILHTGNESNLQKLLRGRGWGTVDENGILDRSRWDSFVARMQKEGILRKVHYDYAQQIWDMFESFKPATQQAHMELYGHYFSEITAKPFDTPFGNYKGGYVPAKADPNIVAEAAIRDERAIFEGNDNSFAFPSTGRGATITRVEAYAKPLILDANYIASHIDWAMRFTHIQPRVKDVARLIMDRSFSEQLEGLDPTVAGDMLVPWMQRAANQRIDLPMKGWGGKFVAQGARQLRSRAGLQIMAANMIVTAEQITHFPSAFVLVKPSSVMDALWRFTRQPQDVAEWVAAKSEFMATRETAALMEIRKTIDNIMLEPSLISRGNDWIAEHGTFLMRSIQSVMDHVTWSAAYDEAVAGGATELEAVRKSDSIVREALGSYAPEDLSRFESGTPIARLFSMFYSFYNTKANLLASEFTATSRSMGLRKGAGRLLYIYTWGFMVPAVLGGAIKHALAGKPFDEDDDGPVDDAFRLFFGSQVEMATRMIPFAGPALQFAFDQFGKHPQGGILNSPAVHLLEEALSAPHDVYKAIHDRMISNKQITDVLTLLGLLTNLPLRPLAKPIAHLRGGRD